MGWSGTAKTCVCARWSADNMGREREEVDLKGKGHSLSVCYPVRNAAGVWSCSSRLALLLLPSPYNHTKYYGDVHEWESSRNSLKSSGIKRFWELNYLNYIKCDERFVSLHKILRGDSIRRVTFEAVMALSLFMQTTASRTSLLNTDIPVSPFLGCLFLTFCSMHLL